jgi:hypothetical protein
LCLSATPPKQQTFVSVADMSTMLARHVGNILLNRSFFAGKVMAGNCIPNTLSYVYVGNRTDEVI